MRYLRLGAGDGPYYEDPEWKVLSEGSLMPGMRRQNGRQRSDGLLTGELVEQSEGGAGGRTKTPRVKMWFSTSKSG